jgi:hypothetical protein
MMREVGIVNHHRFEIAEAYQHVVTIVGVGLSGNPIRETFNARDICENFVPALDDALLLRFGNAFAPMPLSESL